MRGIGTLYDITEGLFSQTLLTVKHRLFSHMTNLIIHPKFTPLSFIFAVVIIVWGRRRPLRLLFVVFPSEFKAKLCLVF